MDVGLDVQASTAGSFSVQVERKALDSELTLGAALVSMMSPANTPGTSPPAPGSRLLDVYA